MHNGESRPKESLLVFMCQLLPVIVRFLVTDVQVIRIAADNKDAVGALGIYEWMRAPLSAGGAG